MPTVHAFVAPVYVVLQFLKSCSAHKQGVETFKQCAIKEANSAGIKRCTWLKLDSREV